MNMWTAIMVISIVAIVSLARIMRLRLQNGLPHAVNQPQEAPELRRELEDLRERVRVLERITTDTNTLAARETRAIAAEIEALRDN